MSSLQHPGSLAASKQNSQPVPKLGQKKRGSTITNSHVLQQNNNTISYGQRPHDIRSDDSNPALFKRRRDQGGKKNKSAQKYGAGPGTSQPENRAMTHVSS